ncbi:MAG: hypothetical protein AAGE52_19070 [Myxococcota bacterium]
MRCTAALLLWALLSANATNAQELTPVGIGMTVPSESPMYGNTGAELTQDGDVYVFDGWGHRPDDGWDMMGFAYAEVAEDFEFSLELLSVPDCSFLNVGLMAREGLVGNERMVFFGYNRSRDGWQWVHRYDPGDESGVNCPAGYFRCRDRENLEGPAPTNVGIRLVRAGGSVRAAFLEDGLWRDVGVEAELPNATFVGVAMSCGNKGAARGETRFRNLLLVGEAESDAGVPDADVPDAGVSDRVPDGGLADAGAPDERDTGADRTLDAGLGASDIDATSGGCSATPAATGWLFFGVFAVVRRIRPR